MKPLLCLVLAFLSCISTSLHACDTNLIALISGATATDAFVEKSAKLVELSVKLGKNIEQADAARAVITEIMNAWVEFDNAFSHIPPPWAKSDGNWKNKFKSLADRIGAMKSAINDNKLDKAHEMVLDFSKRLTVLYEYMPKDALGEQLYLLSQSFLKLNDSLNASEMTGFKQALGNAIGACDKIKQMLESDDEKKIIAPLTTYLEELKNTIENDPTGHEFKVRMALMTAEDSFVTMNEKLRPTAAKKQE